MKNAVDIFVELGDRLAKFGQNTHTQSIVDAACRENPWFRPAEVMRAVETIRVEFLDREKITHWLARYPRTVTHPRSVLVVMAGNIPLVGFFDLLCVVAAGCRCVVKPSAKDTVLMRYVIDLLKDIEPDIPIGFYTGKEPFDTVIATGSDNTNRYFRTEYANIPALLRGNRHSVAVLSGDETPVQMAALADDIFGYSGLGCRNISMIFLPEGKKIPAFHGSPSSKYRNNARQRKAIRRVCGLPFEESGAALLVEQQELPHALSEVAVMRYSAIEQVKAWLSHHENEIQCVVCDDKNLIDCPGYTPFGTSQRPSLSDYPDRTDVMEFLYCNGESGSLDITR